MGNDMWWKQNKWKAIAPLAIVIVLLFAFWYGGSSPSSRGWSANSLGADPSPASTSPAPSAQASPSPSQGVEIGGDTQASPPPEGSEPAPPEDEEALFQQPGETDPEPSSEPSPEPSPEPSMQIDPDTGLDLYQTQPVPEGKPLPVEPQDVTVGTDAYTCTISISCATILDNMDLCDKDKAELVPEDGWILEPVEVTFYEGESVFNVLQRTCKQNGIHMEYMNTPIYNSAYIEGISNLYEFDVGELSGWVYKVNEWSPNYGCSRYQLSDGDVISWEYTCDLGRDVGGTYFADE